MKLVNYENRLTILKKECINKGNITELEKKIKLFYIIYDVMNKSLIIKNSSFLT